MPAYPSAYPDRHFWWKTLDEHNEFIIEANGFIHAKAGNVKIEWGEIVYSFRFNKSISDDYK